MPMPDQYDGDRALWKQAVFDPSIQWLLAAIASAHLSKRITLSARRLLAFGGCVQPHTSLPLPLL
jgi:hypothetical protein